MYSSIYQNVHKDWRELCQQEFGKDYMSRLLTFIESEESEYQVVPDRKDWLKALEMTSINNCHACIIGQDPYFGGQAHGLSFSIKAGFKVAPSLKNIFKEIESSMGQIEDRTGNLEGWASKVLLLNSCLTTRYGEAGAHAKKGWETFTSEVIKKLNASSKPIVFLSWGRWAHKATENIDQSKHLLIKTSHPSPLGATKQSKIPGEFDAFIGSQCFVKANEFLRSQGRDQIDWRNTSGKIDQIDLFLDSTG